MKINNKETIAILIDKDEKSLLIDMIDLYESAYWTDSEDEKTDTDRFVSDLRKLLDKWE